MYTGASGLVWGKTPAVGEGAKAGGGRADPTVEEHGPGVCGTGAAPSVGQQLKNPEVNNNN